MYKRIKRLIVVGLTGLAIATLPLFESNKQEAEAEFEEPPNLVLEQLIQEGQSADELLTFEDNTLLAVTDPQTPKETIVSSCLSRIIVTAYSSSPDETWGDPFLTASGSWVREGIVAANFLPMGTKIKIPSVYGDKIFVVEDRMHPRKKWHVDIWFPSKQEALDFGAKYTEIEVLKEI